MGRFVPATHDDLAPSGAKARFRANIAAIETARLLVEQAGLPAYGALTMPGRIVVR